MAPGQIYQTIEEMAELTVELSRAGTKKYDIDKIREEVADSLIMLYQMRDLYGPEEVDDWIQKKLKRMEEK